MLDLVDKKFLFITCGSRGGAALIGAMLNAHSEIAFSTDQIKFFAFVKERFPEINKSNLNKVLEEFKLRLDIRFDIKFDTNMCLSLIKEDYSLENLYISFLLTTYKMDQGSNFFGECENMSWKNIPFFISKVPNSKSFSIIRDPRDVLFSFKNSTFATCSDYLINVFNTKGLMQSSLKYIKLFKEKFYTIKFENLKADPKKEIKEICKYINVDFEHKMLNDKYWKILSGEGWIKWKNKKVSSFNNREKIHNPVGRWRGKIDKVDHFIVEWILKKEMIKFGYKLEFEGYSEEIFIQSIERLTSSKLLIEAFSNYLLNDIGSTNLPLDRFNPIYWDMKSVSKKDKIKKLAELMGYSN